eukprot:scaffold176028_cov51-Attheya_sp.AAC.2
MAGRPRLVEEGVPIYDAKEPPSRDSPGHLHCQYHHHQVASRESHRTSVPMKLTIGESSTSHQDHNMTHSFGTTSNAAVGPTQHISHASSGTILHPPEGQSNYHFQNPYYHHFEEERSHLHPTSPQQHHQTGYVDDNVAMMEEDPDQEKQHCNVSSLAQAAGKCGEAFRKSSARKKKSSQSHRMVIGGQQHDQQHQHSNYSPHVTSQNHSTSPSWLEIGGGGPHHPNNDSYSYNFQTPPEVVAQHHGSNQSTVPMENRAMNVEQYQQQHEHYDHGITSSMVPVERMEVDDILAKAPLIVMDGANVAHAYTDASKSMRTTQKGGRKPQTPSVHGIYVALQYFLQGRCRVQVVLPQYWMTQTNPNRLPIVSPNDLILLQKLDAQGYICKAPPTDDDDAYALIMAMREDARAKTRTGGPKVGNAHVLSNDLFRDAIKRDDDANPGAPEASSLRHWLKGGRISYAFCDMGSLDSNGDLQLDFLPNPRHTLITQIERDQRTQNLSQAVIDPYHNRT